MVIILFPAQRVTRRLQNAAHCNLPNNEKPMIPRYLSQSLCTSYVTHAHLLLIITTQHHNINTTLSGKNDLAYGVSQPYAKPAATARSSRYPYQCLSCYLRAQTTACIKRSLLLCYSAVATTCTSFTASNPVLL